MEKFRRPLSEVWSIERKRAEWVWLIGEYKFDLTDRIYILECS